jgi:serine phosphatase RsbU (regulator of sigma subunit)/tetratricopeptide (TPR) repeat protein
MTLFNDLGTLESAGLIQVAQVEPDLEYLFSHSLVQDVAYTSLLEADRKRLHHVVGGAIERLYPERKRELAALLAYHFKEAGDDERAMGYFIVAGDEALKVFANQEAEYQYRSALQLVCCSGKEIAWLYSGLGEALYRQSRLDESLQAFRKGIEIYKSMADYDGVARLYARLARVTWYAYDRPQGLRIALEGLQLLQAAPGSPGKAALIHETARAYYFNGMADKALPLCREALSLAEQLGAVSVQADSLATLGILPGISPQESLQALQKAVEISESHGLLQIAMRANQNLGEMTRAWLADNQASMRYYQRAAQLGQMRGVASEEVIGEMSYTACLFSEGNPGEIEAHIAHMDELARHISDPRPTLLSVKFMRALLAGYKADWDAALSATRECLQGWQELENLESQVYSLDQLSWLLLEKDRWGQPADLAEAEAYLEQARKIVERDAAHASMWLYPRFCALKARQGKLDEARLWFQKTIQHTQARPSAWDAHLRLECQVEISRAQHDWAAALSQIEALAREESSLRLYANHSHSLLCWADLLLQTGEPADLEKAQVIAGQALESTIKLGQGNYREIAENSLQQIRSRLHTQTLDHVQMTQELKKARQVQASLLPENTPELPGWQMDVILQPAHETSGDFYDFLPLPGEKIGIVIADVTDKGTGAALFMALGRALWRTFALEHPSEPEQTMTDTNQRLLADTHGGLFITLFYGILDPRSGELTYCSAGHLPGLLLRAADGSLDKLPRTGMPVGAIEGATWNRASVQIARGDSLVLYTDGITEASNASEQFFGQERLEAALQKLRLRPAGEIRHALLAEVASWVGKSAQFDDLTLMVLVREASQPEQ